MFAFTTSAQTSDTKTNTVNITIQSAIVLTVTALQTQNITVTSLADFTNGVATTSPSTFSVASNRLYNVSVVPNSNNFSHSAGWSGSSTTLPASVLEVRKNGTTTFTAFSNTSTPVSILTNGAIGSTTFGVDYKANPGLSTVYPDDTYTITLTYTATQQ
jgi:hypothetical protein